jgi:hypothetical protein
MDQPMTTPDPSAPSGPAADAPLTILRGAGVDVDARRVVQVLLCLLMAALAVLIVVLALAGVHRNAQITRLRQHGVAVTVTVSSCEGLLGGSGSNAAGYSCRGDITLGGHRYNVVIPGTRLFPPGTMLRLVAVPGDPSLLSPLHAVTTEHASWRVFILPAILLLVLLLLVGLLTMRWRRHHGATSPLPPPDTN